MKRKFRDSRGSVDIIEEAVHLLRSLAPGDYAFYYLGTIPFILLFLYFWSDMSRGAYAFSACSTYAVGLVVLYVWMRTWQTVFCRRMRARLVDERPVCHGFRRLCSLALMHLALSTWGLWGLLAGLILVFPIAWVYAYHQHLVVMMPDKMGSISSSYENGLACAKKWPHQNHSLIGLLSLFKVFVFFNVCVAIIYTPYLLQMVFGIATNFTKSVHWIFNSTFNVSALGLTYLITDPLSKAIYTVRNFHVDAVETGEDLLYELEKVRTRSRAPHKAGLIIALLLTSLSVTCAEYPVINAKPVISLDTEQASISPTELDGAIRQTLTDPEYAWRMPRDAIAREVMGENVFTRFSDSIVSFMKKTIKTIGKGIERLVEWFQDVFDFDYEPPPSGEGGKFEWTTVLKVITWGLVLVFAVLLVSILIKGLRREKSQGVVGEALAASPIPDLENEQVLASDLPGHEWIRLAEELLGQREYRKALRAYFLAALALMDAHGFVDIRPFKSNRDYRRELESRGKRAPELFPAFRHSVSLFERVWYGFDEASDVEVADIRHRVEELEKHVQS